MKFGFGVDLGGTTVKIAYFDQDGTLLDKWEIPTVTANNGEQILPDIANSVLGYLSDHNIAKEQIIGIGIGVPGPVNSKGVVNKCVNLGWGVFNIEQTLADLTGFPVKAGNDANVAAMGEYWKGGGKGYDNLVMATLGTGVGGGIVVDGRLVYGKNGCGGEIGHLVQKKTETLSCGCGKKGCTEQYCSATGIVRTAKEFMEKDSRPTPLRQFTALTCKDIFDASAAGDAVAAEILEIVYDNLAEFICNLCAVLDPEVVVLGGGVSKAGSVLLEGIAKYFPKYMFHAIGSVKLSLAVLGNDAGAYGAFKLALDAFA